MYPPSPRLLFGAWRASAFPCLGCVQASGRGYRSNRRGSCTSVVRRRQKSHHAPLKTPAGQAASLGAPRRVTNTSPVLCADDSARLSSYRPRLLLVFRDEAVMKEIGRIPSGEGRVARRLFRLLNFPPQGACCTLRSIVVIYQVVVAAWLVQHAAAAGVALLKQSAAW